MAPKKIVSDVEKYDKITPREHVLLRPDTYIGDVEPTKDDMWIYSEETNKMVKKKITYTPGFLKIYDETLVNARDASVNDNTCDTIKIEYNIEEGFISIFNNGDIGIPVEEHPVHKSMVPSMIFGELLTSSNYNDTEERTTGGRNGLGSKVSNIFSTKFIVEIDDAKRGKKFQQTWTNNMLIAEDAIITKLSVKMKSSVKVTFYPDLKRFGINNLDNDHYSLFYKRAFDISGTSTNKLKIFFNNKKIETNTFKSYIDLYYSLPTFDIYYDTNASERWIVGVLYNHDAGGEQISFVNGINTYRGGTHCNHVIDNIIKVLINDYIKKKDKDLKITPTILKDNLSFFINSTIINPAFASQTKDTLTTKADKFGSKYEPTPLFLKKLAKCGIVEQMIELAKFKESSSLKKTDGKKQVKIIGIPKLEDANKAGTKESSKCTLILTEGDSAKATAMAGLSVIGRDFYGVFPLKGKLLNVREATAAQLLNNEELKSLKIIIGLKQNEDYSNDDKFNSLRYGHILLLTDSDVDGSHIKGLFINMLHTMWPSLIKRDDFVLSLNTPIVKATKGKDIISFYNLTDYDIWKDTSAASHYKIKYYKGLGTSTSQEAKEYFTDIDTKTIKYYCENIDKINNIAIDIINDDVIIEEKEEEIDDEEKDSADTNDHCFVLNDDNDSIKLAFEKCRSDDRKKWLICYDKNETIDSKQRNVPYSVFVHRDLKHYSNENIIRSIPSVIDGCKPSQRKIIYGAFTRGLDKEEVKVSQLAGIVSDKSAYHHGEMSLNGAIIGMAQNFTGSNNINILKPIGQFGSILKGGMDFASPRYIWTMFDELTTIIYNPIDNPILDHQYEDGNQIEPEFYVPIIPMVLVNGAQGIGTGFSTKIPPYNPLQIIQNIKNIINEKEYEYMDPWWQGFNGTVAKINDYTYEIYGTWTINNNKLIITELPVGEWTSDYKELLEKLLEDNQPVKGKPTDKIKKQKKNNSFLDYKDNNTDTTVYFELLFEDNYLETAVDIDKTFHLCKKYSITNMHLYSPEGHIKKYNTIEEIMRDFYRVRLKYYEKRKVYQLDILEFQLKLISYKVKFILMITNKEIDISNKKKTEIELILENNDFPKLGKSNDDSKISFDYLLSMPLYNLTNEKIEELKKQMTDKETDYNDLISKSETTIWLEELDALEQKYTKWYNKKLETVNPTVKKVKKPTSKKN